MQRRCAVIVATGTAETAAVEATAARAIGVHFVDISAPTRPHSNIISIDPASTTLGPTVAAAVQGLISGTPAAAA